MTKCCFIGLDVGRYEMFACVLSENREEITSFCFPQTPVVGRTIECLSHFRSRSFSPASHNPFQSCS